MRKGDLVIPYRYCAVTEKKDPDFHGRGRHRQWDTDQPALIVAEATRSVRGIDILKFQILLDGELWWIGAGAARLVEPRNETR